LIVILGAVLIFFAIFCLVMALSSRSVTSPLEARMATLRGDRPVMDYRAMTQSESITVRVFAPLADSLGAKLEKLLPSRWIQSIQKSLVMAGQPVTLTGFLIAMAITEATTVLLGFMLVSAGGMPPMQALMTIAGTSVLGLFLPRVWLGNRVRYRQKAILKSLPDAFDLITVCVEAGLGLDAALAKVAEKVEGPFGEELAIALKEISLGKLRRDALKELGDRSGVPDLISFINAVVQAESMGTSIANVLRVQAEQMRIRRRQRAEQQAQAAPIKMMFPLVFCIFPTLFIVILGPAAITLYQELVNR
jgi:tight adherence protein C